MMQLRPYQREAIDAVYRHLRERNDQPCVVLPTGSGKTVVMSTICDDAITKWNGRVLVLAHVRELLEQTKNHLAEMAPNLQVGVYSAGLKRRDTEHAVIVAGIQSIFRRACELGAFDLIIVDECHFISPEGETMYRTFLADARAVNPRVRLVGLTATAYRMTSGMICTPENFLNHVCFEVSVKELIRDGYLCPLKSKAGSDKADFENLHVRGGEFIAGEVESAMDTDALVRSACEEIIAYTKDRKSVLIFASGVQHGQHIQRVIQEVHGAECGFVHAGTPDDERDELIARFKRNGDDRLFGNRLPLKFLCNINVLAIGFDAPNIDCIAMLRPTMSPGLYYQQVGRGFRLCPGKTDCLVLDFGGNVLRHGPVDDIRIQEQDARGNGEAPAKECPNCHELVHAAYAVCPECGHEFPPPERQKHEPKASTATILSDEVAIVDHKVQSVVYNLHTKKGSSPEHPKTMRVDYQVGFDSWITEWICIEHTGWARHRAESWWEERSHEPCPTRAGEAAEIGRTGGLANTLAIKVRHVTDDKFPRIIGYTLSPKPRMPGWDEEPEPATSWIDESEVPF